MSYFLIQGIIASAAILHVSPLPVKVSVSPNYIITDVGTESVNITCTVQLDPVSAASAHLITWSHVRITGRKPVAYNDTVIDQEKYSVHGTSSITNSAITQILTIHGIEEDDIGTYICFFNIVGDRRLPAYFSLVLRNDIAPVKCFYPTELRELRCSCPPGDPLITLQIIARDGNVLAENTQSSCNKGPSVKYNVPTESLYQGEQFICVATSPGSVKTQECIFTPNMPYENTSFSFYYYQSTVDASVGTEMFPITPNSNDESGNSFLTSSLTPPVSHNQNTKVQTSNKIQLTEESIIVIYIVGIINIVMNVALLYIIVRKNKHKRNTEMSMKPHDIRQKHGDSTKQHASAPPQDDDYMNVNYTPNIYDQLEIPA